MHTLQHTTLIDPRITFRIHTTNCLFDIKGPMSSFTWGHRYYYDEDHPLSTLDMENHHYGVYSDNSAGYLVRQNHLTDQRFKLNSFRFRNADLAIECCAEINKHLNKLHPETIHQSLSLLIDIGKAFLTKESVMSNQLIDVEIVACHEIKELNQITNQQLEELIPSKLTSDPEAKYGLYMTESEIIVRQNKTHELEDTKKLYVYVFKDAELGKVFFRYCNTCNPSEVSAKIAAENIHQLEAEFYPTPGGVETETETNFSI